MTERFVLLYMTAISDSAFRADMFEVDNDNIIEMKSDTQKIGIAAIYYGYLMAKDKKACKELINKGASNVHHNPE